MSDEIEDNIQIDKLLKMLDLGDLIIQPKPVFGGLLHKSFEVTTRVGHYFIKALNPQIMLRPTAMRNLLFADEVSHIALGAGISASAVKSIQGKTIHCVEGQFYQVFDWVEGVSYSHQPENFDQCYKIGVILGQLHQVDFSSVHDVNMTTEERQTTDWQGILNHADHADHADHPDWIHDLKCVDIDYIASAESDAIEALKLLNRLVISHRDLDPKNVMWKENGSPMLIDWEAAGYVNPTFEMIEVAVYWSEYSDGNIHPEAFLEVIKGYQSICSIDFKEVEYVWRAMNINKIGWIEYNLKRAVGIEVNSVEERYIGFRQVVETAKSIRRLEEQLETLKAALSHLKQS